MTKYIGNILTDGAPVSYSCVFDGTGDYLSVPTTSGVLNQTGDFTYEMWIYWITMPTTGYQNISGQGAAGQSSYGLFAGNASADTWAAPYRFKLNVANQGDVLVGNTELQAGQWYHLAHTRTSGVNRLFVNGVVQTNTYTDSTSRTFNGNPYLIANNSNCYLSNFRFIQGTSLYTASFNPPTPPLSARSGTQLLTCQQPTIVDMSSNALAITANGDARVSTFGPPTVYQPYNPALGGATPGLWSLNDAAYAAQTRQWNMYDPYWDNVTLLLNGENAANGAQNNTFLDSSTNNFTITRNGNTTQGTFSPYGNLWSNYFDGSGDYLSRSVTSNTDGMYLQGTTYTLEAWIYMTSTSGLQIIYDCSGTNTGFFATTAIYVDSGVLKYGVRPNTGSGFPVTEIVGSTLAANTWHHVAFSVSSGSGRLFLNGVQTGSTTTFPAAAFTPVGAAIGRFGNGYTLNVTDFTGYISNLRIVQGQALYTSNFTPSTTPLTAVSGTSLLTCQSNRFIDNSSNNFTLTVNGNTSVQRFSPFNPTAPYSAATIGGSGYFDGSGDYLTLANNAAFEVGTGDFTIEFWGYWNSVSSTIPGNVCHCVNNGTLGIYIINNSMSIARYNTGGDLTANTTQTTGQWDHYAFTRQSGTGRIFKNGVQVASGSVTTNYGQNGFQIGTGVSSAVDGYISNLRFVKGTALYTSNFTPPTAPLTAVSGTSLLCNFTNAGIPDAAMMNDLETVGNAQVSTSVKKYGTGSLAFDGTGDCLVSGVNQLSEFGSGAFTVEFWLYLNTVGSIQNIVFHGWSGSGAFNEGWSARVNASNQLAFFANSGGGTYRDFTDLTVSSAQWYHVAFVGNGGVLSAYLNGTKSTTTYTYTTIQPSSALTTVVGGWNDNNVNLAERYFLNGYIDDLRITKGLARYTANFTPPTSSLQNL